MRAPILFVLLLFVAALSAGACAAAAAPITAVPLPAPGSVGAAYGEGEVTLEVLELI